LPDLASSLYNLGILLSELGRREEALEATTEALDIHRRLAAQRPEAFLPDLVRSLETQGSAQLQNESWPEAAATFAEALTLLLPFARRYSWAFRDLTFALARNVALAWSQGSIEPDTALMDEVEAIYGSAEGHSETPL
jgi:tetratricopeptide (TPR) repeat protein